MDVLPSPYMPGLWRKPQVSTVYQVPAVPSFHLLLGLPIWIYEYFCASLGIELVVRPTRTFFRFSIFGFLNSILLTELVEEPIGPFVRDFESLARICTSKGRICVWAGSIYH